jgi:hypothetical protein
MTRVLINFCSIEELMLLPGVGAKGADTILEMREAKGDLELEDISQVPYLRLTPHLIKCLDFTPFKEGEDLILKIEKRFGFRELPETAQVKFNNARQIPEELLENLADRFLSLATRAFRELPEKHMYQQAVGRFCQGAADKEAGSYASNIRPNNIEEAIDKIRWHQHNHQAIYGRTPRREVKQVSPGSHHGGKERVCVTG